MMNRSDIDQLSKRKRMKQMLSFDGYKPGIVVLRKEVMDDM